MRGSAVVVVVVVVGPAVVVVVVVVVVAAPVPVAALAVTDVPGGQVLSRVPFKFNEPKLVIANF